MKDFKMFYPNIKDNSLYDGKTHIIEPIQVSKLSNLNIYLLDYLDKDKELSTYTLLKNNNGILMNQPIYNNSLKEDIDKYNIPLLEEYINKLFNNQRLILSYPPSKDLKECLKEFRKSINLFITSNHYIMFIDGNRRLQLNYSMLAEVMQEYDIKWLNQSDNKPSSEDDIFEAINKTFTRKQNKFYLLKYSFSDDYVIDNIHHYVV